MNDIKNKHANDPRIKSATYRIKYPDDFRTLNHPDDFAEIETKEETSKKYIILEKNLAFNFKLENIKDKFFDKCNFHSEHGLEMTTIEKLTFYNCTFQQNFLGSILFIKVRFRNCNFIKCDFMNSEFKNCFFENCDFSKCTAENTEFLFTEINPISFLSAIELPKDNFMNEKEKSIKKLKRKWLDIEFRLATSLYKSNSNALHSSYSDSALYELKKKEYAFLYDLWRHRNSLEEDNKYSFFKCLINTKTGFQLLFLRLNLGLTKGGISYGRLFWLAIIIIVIVDFLIGFTSIKHNSNPLKYTDNIGSSVIIFFENLPYTASLFFSYGFTLFSTDKFMASILLSLTPLLGLIWLAFLIQVLLRKIYK